MMEKLVMFARMEFSEVKAGLQSLYSTAEKAIKTPDGKMENLEVEKKEGGVTTMTKTRSDWAQAKAAGGAAMEEELEAHKKSGSTYLDKQEFLKKAEWKEYEQTREAKLRAEGVSR